MRIYLIRHIQTEGNVGRLYQGHIDAPPTQQGLEQLEKLKTRFKDRYIDIIYTSHLGRAITTAEAINESCRVPIVKCGALAEMYGGDFEGRNFDLLREQYPSQMHALEHDLQNFKAPGGESIGDVIRRVKGIYNEIVWLHHSKRVVIVSHALAIKCMLSEVLNIPISDIDETVPRIKNASVTRIDYDIYGKPFPVYLSQTDY
jgi:broad specificity phosphatase PhoE